MLSKNYGNFPTNVCTCASRRRPTGKCGLRDYGVPGQLGLEKTPEEYVANLVEIFREVKRVLRKDGTLWLNLGDSYATHASGGKGYAHNFRKPEIAEREGIDQPKPTAKSINLKEKDLVGIPWRVAFALQADGWYFRSDIIWSKPNPMPESVSGSRWERHKIKIKDEPERTEAGKLEGFRKHSGYKVFGPEWADCPGCLKCLPNDGLILRMSAGRPTKAHEYIFLLSKSERYFFDQEAVKEPTVVEPRIRQRPNGAATYEKFGHDTGCGVKESGRNIRSVWTMTTKSFKEAHFATFPPELPERCIKAGTSEKGVCPKCGAPWVRIIDKGNIIKGEWGHNRPLIGKYTESKESRGEMMSRYPPGCHYENTAIGWRPSCRCNAGNPIPATVLDPFFGAGTVGVVAKQLGRNFIGIELKSEYCEMAERRIVKIACQKSLDILLSADASSTASVSQEI